MSRRRYKTQHLNHEFDLDLAPLLAVMVKLVPVLLISSSFVSIMMVETDLPQAVKQAVEQNQKQEEKTQNVSLSITKDKGFVIHVEGAGAQMTEEIPLVSSGELNFGELNKHLQSVKSHYPKVFRIEFRPDGKVSYDEIVKAMDEARKSRDKAVTFPVFDAEKGKDVQTDYMFPDVVFSNALEG